MSNGMVDTTQLFAGMKNAEVKTGGQTPKPAFGLGWYLVERIELKISEKDQKPFVPFTYKCVRPISDEANRQQGTEGYAGEIAGAKVSPMPLFAGTYFDAGMKRFVVAAMGITADQVDEMIQGTIPDMKEAAASGMFQANPNGDDIDNAWKYISDNIIGNLKGVDCGCFDGQLVMELKTVRTVKKNETGTGKMVDGVFVPDPDKEYSNTYPERRVSFTEVQNAIGHDTALVTQLFGSAENLAQRVATEQQG